MLLWASARTVDTGASGRLAGAFSEQRVYDVSLRRNRETETEESWQERPTVPPPIHFSSFFSSVHHTETAAAQLL